MDILLLILRIAGTLAAVLAIYWLARRGLSSLAKARARTRHVTVLAKQAVGVRASVAVVEADGRRYLIGVTDRAVTLLDRLETEPAAVSTTPIPLPAPDPALGEAGSAPAAVRDPIHLPVTRRAVREAAVARAGEPPAPGSLLSPSSWRQGASALGRAR